jgi:YidC/Oxa1 family membrane protein insertase
MDLWSLWIDGLARALALLGSHGGMSPAWAVAVLTVAARLLMMPVSVAVACRMDRTRRTMARLKPELDALKEKLKDDPAALARETLALQRANGVRLIDRLTLANIAGQALFGFGMFRLLRRGTIASRFLWIANTALPDLALALLTGLIMAAALSLAPGSQGHVAWVMMLIPVAVTVISLLSLPSAIGIYWAAANGVSLVQAVVIRQVLARGRRS